MRVSPSDVCTGRRRGEFERAREREREMMLKMEKDRLEIKERKLIYALLHVFVFHIWLKKGEYYFLGNMKKRVQSYDSDRDEFLLLFLFLFHLSKIVVGAEERQ